MANQTKKISVPRTIEGSSSIRTLGHLERIAGIVRESGRLGRAAANIAMVESPRLRIFAPASLLKLAHLLAAAGIAEERSGQSRGNAEELVRSIDKGRDELLNGSQGSHATARYRATALVDAGSQASRQIRQPASKIAALSRIEHSAVSTATAQRIDGARVSAAAGVSGGARENLDAREAFARDGFVSGRAATRIRALIPPQSVSRREFAQSRSNLREPGSGGAGAGITINSSPTVVINAPTTGANVQREVIGALRAHREELFDQLKRESTRRERAQY